jgi:hypothetical protein
MNAVELNWVAIMVAAFVVYVFAAAWYSPVLFIKRWQELTKVTDEQMQRRFIPALVVQAVQTVVTAAIVAVVVSWAGANNPLEGAAIGLLLGGGLVALDHTKLVAFEYRPVALFAINNGATVLAFMIMGAILAWWS